MTETKTAPHTPAEGESPIEAALRDAFPHFQDGAEIAPEAIKKLGGEWLEMVMGWAPVPKEIKFQDANGNDHTLKDDEGWYLDAAVIDDDELTQLRAQVEELKAQQVQARASTVAGPVTEAELATAYRYLLEKPSTSYLQRKMGLGYNRAAAIMETLESEGCVSAPDATGKRHILKQDRTLSHSSTVGASTRPTHYSKLPDGMVCKCPALWRDEDGSHWCCKGKAFVQHTPHVSQPATEECTQISDRRP